METQGSSRLVRFQRQAMKPGEWARSLPSSTKLILLRCYDLILSMLLVMRFKFVPLGHIIHHNKRLLTRTLPVISILRAGLSETNKHCWALPASKRRRKLHCLPFANTNEPSNYLCVPFSDVKSSCSWEILSCNCLLQFLPTSWTVPGTLPRCHPGPSSQGRL